MILVSEVQGKSRLETGWNDYGNLVIITSWHIN